MIFMLVHNFVWDGKRVQSVFPNTDLLNPVCTQRNVVLFDTIVSFPSEVLIRQEPESWNKSRRQKSWPKLHLITYGCCTCFLGHFWGRNTLCVSVFSLLQTYGFLMQEAIESGILNCLRPYFYTYSMLCACQSKVQKKLCGTLNTR
jgi:hypothetical protein